MVQRVIGNSLFPSRLSIILLFIGCFVSHSLQAQTTRTAAILRDETVVFPDRPALLDSFRQLKSASLVLIQFRQTPDLQQKCQLAKASIQLLQAFNAQTFLAYIQPDKQAIPHVGVRSAVPFQARWKLSLPLQGMISESAQQDLFVSLRPGCSRIGLEQIVKRLGGSIGRSELAALGYYRIMLPGNQLLELAKAPEILAITEAAKNIPLNYESQRALQVNIAHQSIGKGGLGLLGDGVTIGVGDLSSGQWHVDTRDRVVNYNPSRYANHGQHTNGTVAGAGTMDPRGEGFAPHALLVDEIFDLIWQRTGALYSAYNMTITSNSYANDVGKCSYTGVYDVYAKAFDSIALAYPDVLHVFAAGNDGKMTCAPFPTSYKTVAGGYQSGKNSLVVGNVNKYGVAFVESSRGPLLDGRLKPEICAIGTTVYSTKGNDQYMSATGTSMACPQIAGTAGLLQEAYKRKHAGAYPSSALQKALLMNGATDMGNPGPDFTYGFGIANVLRSAAMIDSNWIYSGTIANGASQNPRSIQVPPNTGQLKVMLYWHDLPASPSSASQLINDLDLKVTDASAITHLPLVLDPSPTAVANPAVQGADHRNNVEQVVIDHPQAGSYLVNVAGYSVPSGPQAYTLVYDLVPTGINITTPNAGDAYFSGLYAINCYWSAPPGTQPFTAEISFDNGASWTTISNSIPPDSRTTLWYIPAGLNSSQCRFRVSRNGTGETSTTGAFMVLDQPKLQLNSLQCPGHVAMHWSPTPQATSYDVFQKVGAFLEKIASVTDTNYTVSGLDQDSLYYFAVQPIVGGKAGFRSAAVKRQPNTGTCAGTISDGDLALRKILGLKSGRVNTSTALGSNETLQVQVQNLDDQSAGPFEVAYQINGGSWTSSVGNSIAALGSSIVSFGGLNLSAPGNYFIRAAVRNLTKVDGVSNNDTLSLTVRQLRNDPVNLAGGFFEDFESLPRLSLMGDSMGFSSSQHWDYTQSTDSGRLRSYVDNDICIGGNRSLSMDMAFNTRAALNQLVGTFNLLGNHTGIDEVRLEFDYRIHGTPKYADSNRVWVRGTDTDPWVPIFTYDTTIPTGLPLNSGTLSITDALTQAGQQFSAATQVAFGQYDTSVIAQNDYGNGLTLDNIKLYKVLNDVGITAVLSPQESNCLLGSNTPLTIRVANGVATPVVQVALFYRYDNGPVESDTIPLLAGKAVVDHTFRKSLNTAAFGMHRLDIWMAVPNDSYSNNDSIMGFLFRNQPVIANFPYLENFEQGEGYWYAAGKSSSWAFGTPSSKKIHRAASGANAWKTSLAGTYNDNESSFLYSPCFDLSSMKNPMLSFSEAMEIENCGANRCDAAWVEYAIGDSTWKKLGGFGQGTNWYTDSVFQVWNSQDEPRWKVSSIPLPKTNQNIRLRFAFNSDPGAGFEGIAVDDIHIYDLENKISIPDVPEGLSHNISGGTTSYKFLTATNEILGSIQNGGEDLGNTTLRSYQQTRLMNSPALQYVLPRSFVLQSAQQPKDTVMTRFYITDDAVKELLADSSCAACSKPECAYALGITKFDHANKSVENGSWDDNTGGTYSFIPARQIKWVPYDAGYYAEIGLSSFSEIWFNDGGATGSFPLGSPSIQFDAQRKDQQSVLCSWQCLVDTAVSSYELQRGDRPSLLQGIATVNSVQTNSKQYTYTDIPTNVRTQALYYRVLYTLKDGSRFFSPIRQIIWSGGKADAQVYPNPISDGLLNIRWTTQPGALMQLAVMDASGRKLLQRQFTASDYLNESKISLGNLAKGIYFVHISIGEEQFNTKLGVH